MKERRKYIDPGSEAVRDDTRNPGCHILLRPHSSERWFPVDTACSEIIYLILSSQKNKMHIIALLQSTAATFEYRQTAAQTT